MIATIERAVGAYAQREQMINFATDFIKESEMHYSAIRQTWPRLYDLWRGTWTTRYAPHRNSVHMPLIFSALWADAARKAATSLSGYPIVSFLGYGPDDMKNARKAESLFAAQAQDDKAFLKQVDMILSGALYGVSVMQVGWKREEKMRIIEAIDRAPLSGQVVRSIRKGKVVMFDGPESKQIDLLDFYPSIGYRTIEEMPRVGRRYFLDLDEVRYLAQEGVFDMAEVKRMEFEGGVNSGQVDSGLSIQRFQSRVGTDDDTARFVSKWSRPVECIDVWGKVPSELQKDGVEDCIVTILNRRYLARYRPIPYWHGMKPFISNTPMPDPHYFYAAGKAEIVAKLQIVANRYINQSLDAADLMIDPMWFYDRGAGIRMSNLYSRPGKMIGVTGDPSRAVHQFERDYGSLVVADKKVDQMVDGIQRGSGIVDDAVAGLEGGGRQTAREFIGRREAAGTRLLLESRLYEAQTLEPLANMFMALNRQFLELPVEVTILGEGAQVDMVTGQPIPSSRETLEGFDLTRNYSARALGASTSLSKGMKQQNLLALLQALSSPLGQQVMGQINGLNFFRGIFREFEIPNLNEIFTENPMLNQMVQSATGGQGGIQNVPTSGQIANGAIPAQALPPTGGAEALVGPPDIANMLPAAAA